MADFMAALGFDYGQLCPPGPEPPPEKEPNRSSATLSGPLPQYSGKQRKAVDTPELPSALTSRSRKLELNRDLTTALELEPDNIMALRERCSLTTTSARYPRQVEGLTRLMELDAENRDLHQVSRAYFYHWLKDDASARADLGEVLRRGNCGRWTWCISVEN